MKQLKRIYNFNFVADSAISASASPAQSAAARAETQEPETMVCYNCDCPDEAARALVGGDDAAESARLHASLDAPCKAALKKLACRCRRPFFSSLRAGPPTLELDTVAAMASTRWPRRRLHDHQRVDASRERAAASFRDGIVPPRTQASRPTPRAAPLHNPARRPATPSLLYAPRTCSPTSA